MSGFNPQTNQKARSVVTDEPTIVAIATPPGQGGVGIVRLSGTKAYTIALALTQKKHLKPRFATYTSFYDQYTLLDQGLALFFKAPHSFTGEDVIELHAHGSPVVLQTIVEVCCNLGAQIAKPGEFSLRAYLNDKIDLTQAESIADLIASTSKQSAKLALRSLQGEFSQRIHALSDHMVQLRLYVEAAIDFPEEEIDFLSDGKIEQTLNQLMRDLGDLLRESSQGAKMREGGRVVIVGQPNVGKSTLLNALAGEELAIVTDIAGTTRDIVKETILLDGFPFQLIDTAGLRETDDQVEQEGIRRTWKAIEQADCILWIQEIPESTSFQDFADLTSSDTKDTGLYGLFTESNLTVPTLPPNIPIIHVFNKIDKSNIEPHVQDNQIYVSAKEKKGLSLLKAKLLAIVGYNPTEAMFLARQRHIEALKAAYAYLLDGQTQLIEHRAGELLAEDLRYAHEALCLITGRFTPDDLLGEIFSSFCIGK